MKNFTKTLSMIACMIFVSNCFGQVQQEMPNWYHHYATVNNQNPNANLERPSTLSAQLYSKAANEKTIQLVLLESEQDIAMLSPEEIANLGINNQGKHSGTVVVSSLGIIVPNLNYFSNDGIVDIELSSADYFSSVPGRSALPTVRSIQITSENGRILTQNNKGSVAIAYESLFDKNLTLIINYENAPPKQLPITVINEQIIFGPNDPQDPQGPLDWGDDYGLECYQCVEELPEPQFMDCSIANDTEIIIAKDQWLGHPLFSGLQGDAYQDYLTYYNASNPGVFEGDDPTRGEIEATYYINPIHGKLTKPIILVDGIDFLSNRNADELLEQLGGEEMLLALFDGGYDLVIADFRGGADFMQKNAMALVELIRQLKKEDNVQEIPAILGPSMGGQVARYALMYWEQNLSDQIGYGPHGIPNFISIDSPWLGANAPPAAMILARVQKDDQQIMNSLDVMVNTPAARQLLIHHFKPSDITESSWDQYHYDAANHPWKDDFYDELVGWGDFPQENIDNYALANGANVDVGFGFNIDAGYYVPPGNKIFTYDSSWSSDPEVRSILEGEKLVRTLKQTSAISFDADNYDAKSTIIDEIDSAPGSGFAIQDLVGADPRIKLNSSFCFIPTFSALGIESGLSAPYEPTAGASTPYFTATTSNGVNNIHMDLQQEEIDFIFGILDYPNVAGQGLSLCESFEYYYQNGGGYFEGNGLYYFDNLVFENNFNIANSDISTEGYIEYDCPNDLLMIYEPTVNINITENSCGLGVSWDPFNNQPIFTLSNPNDYESQFNCQIEMEICVTHPACPSFQECETMNWFLSIEIIEGDMNASTGDINQNALMADSENSEIKFSKELKIYPNPTSEKIFLELLEGSNKLEVYTIDGKLVSSELLESNASKVEKLLERGTYIVRVTNENSQETEVKKIIVL